MRITMLTLSASPEGVLEAGRTYQAPQHLARDQAQALVDGGYAVLADPPAPTTVPAPAPEDPGAQATPLDKLTVVQLQAYAAENDIDLGDAKLKADLLAAIAAAETGGG